jgi:hypothetical protein
MIDVRVVGALALGLSVLVSMPVPAGAQADRRAQVKELMTLTGARSIGVQMGSMVAQQFFAAMRASNPSIPDEVHAVIEQVAVALFSERADDLIERMVPLYERHFTSGELAELILFYKTPTGRKAIQALPQLMQESVPISQAWAQSFQLELERRIRERLGAAKPSQ